MKRFDPEIESLVKKCAGSAKVGDRGEQKLLALLRRAEAVFPDFPERPFDVTLLRNADPGAKAPLVGRRILRWAPIPAMAAAIVIAFFLVNRNLPGTAPEGRIVMVAGSPSMQHGVERRRCVAGAVLRPGDRITTDAISRIDASIESMYRMRIMPESEIVINRLYRTGMRREAQFDLLRGSVIVHAWGLKKGDLLTVNAPGSRTVVTGTVFSVNAGRDGTVRYTVYEGSIKVARRMPDNIDPKTSVDLQKMFNDNAVVVTDNQRCDVVALKREILTSSGARDAIERSGKITIDDAAGHGKDFGEFMAAAGKDVPVIVSVGFTIEPSGAALYVDGKLRRPAGGKIMLTAGPHILEARMEGFEPWTGRMIAGPDVSTAIRLVRRAGTDRPLVHAYVLEERPDGSRIGVTRDGTLEMLAGGRSSWRCQAGGSLSAKPVISHGMVIAAVTGGDIIAVSATNGAILWRTRLPAFKDGADYLAADDEGIYVSTGSGRFAKVSRTGAILWMLDVARQMPIPPVVDRYLIMAAFSDGWLLVVDKRKGARVMSSPVKDVPSIMTAHHEKLYAVTRSGRAWCYNTASGEFVWESGKTKGAVTDLAADGDNVYFVTSRGEILMIGPDGRPLWKFDAGAPFKGAPARDVTGIYAIAGKTFCAVDRVKGELMWSLVMEQIPTGKISLTRDRILIEMKDGSPTVLKK